MKTKIALAANTDWYLFNFRKQLISTLIDEGYEVVIVSPDGSYVPQLEDLGCTHVPWEVGRQTINPIKERQSIQNLRKIYLDISPSLIHHHTLKSVIYGNIATRNTNIPIVNSIPGRGYTYSSESLKARSIRPVVDLLLRYAMNYPKQQLIFENNDDMNYFLQKGFVPEENVNLIKSVGVDIDVFQPAPIPEFEQFTIGYVGRMLWNKGVGIFVEAAKLLKKLNPKIRMVLIGLPDPGNPESINKEQLTKWDDENVIEWWGWQPDMPKVYHKIHGLAFPTNYGEGIPTVLLEAGASQRALIATDSPSCREVIEDGINGYLIDINDSKALAERVFHLSQNEAEYHRLRNNGYQKIIHSFSRELIINKTIEIYQKLI